MKHIRKRFLAEMDASNLEPEAHRFDIIENVPKGIYKHQLSGRESKIGWAVTDENLAIPCFIFRENGNYYYMPVPEPPLIYFNYAQSLLKHIKTVRKELMDRLRLEIEAPKVPPVHEIYHFYSLSSNFVINLITTIASFVNRRIPDEYVFQQVKNACTEFYSKEQIQRNIDLKTKLKYILPELTHRKVFTGHARTMPIIWELKRLRDELIHLKDNGGLLRYDSIIKQLLNFRYESSLDAVAELINYYQPKYIEECDCGSEE